MRRTRLLGLIVLVLFDGVALGQSLFPSGGMFANPNAANRRHMGPTGSPCLALEAYAKAQTTNKNIFEHWIGARNSCGQYIKVKVCYYQTQDCIVMDVPPWDRQDSVLGIFPALSEFRFESREQF